MIMPFTFSITNGIGIGFLAFVVGPGGTGPRERSASLHVDRLVCVPPLLPRPIPAGHVRLDLRTRLIRSPGCELAFLPATEQARLVREREVTPLELVELYLERIERLDPELGAFVTVCGDEALADARAKTDAPTEAPFHGVPISLKDLDTTAGIRTTFSSSRVRGQHPRFRPRSHRQAPGGRGS